MAEPAEIRYLLAFDHLFELSLDPCNGYVRHNPRFWGQCINDAIKSSLGIFRSKLDLQKCDILVEKSRR